MFSRSIKWKNKAWDCASRSRRCFTSLNRHGHSAQQCFRPLAIGFDCSLGSDTFSSSFLPGVVNARTSLRLNWRSDFSSRYSLLRYFSSKGDGSNASENKRAHSQETADCDKEKTHKESMNESTRNCDAHAKLGEQDQIEWLKTEKLAIEYKKKESPFIDRRARFKNEFLRRIIPWEKISVSWDTFPYYLHDHTKSLLIDCITSHLHHKKFATDYGSRLTSSSGRILLQSMPGTELFRERLVKALARGLQVPLMMLDGSILAPYDHGEDEIECDEDNSECSSESDVEDENDGSNEEDFTSSGETKSDGSDDEAVDIKASAEALRKLIPYNIEDFEKSVSGESEDSSASTHSENSESSNRANNRPLMKGDAVKYVGQSVKIEANNRVLLGKIPTSDGSTNAYTVIRGRTLSNGQRGEVYEVNGDQVAVIFDTSDKALEEVKDENTEEHMPKATVCWIPLKDLEHDLEARTHDFRIAMEVLCQVLESRQPIIVYFPDSSLWLPKALPKSDRKEFIQKMREMFDQLSGPVVLIYGVNKGESGPKEKGKFTMILPNLGRIAKLPLPLKRLTEGLKDNKKSKQDDLNKLFCNVMCIHPPKEEDLLRTFNKQIEEDRRIVISRSNFSELHKVLEEHGLSCMDLLHVNTDGVVLTREKSEKVVGWAKNHYLSSCLLPSVKGDRLQLPRESLEIAISRLKEMETALKKPSQNLKNLAKDEYETNFVSAVVPPGEIGVKFDDVGALEDVKKALNELVILPMRRPELFNRGNLLRPCKGILLFGPPGTGKTLLAKALATEAGANFISITGSSLTSKWFGDAEKLTKALFSFASKLAPVIIFVDEVDSLLGARGGAFEHEATRRMRNEFMAAWDGLRSKESQRIVILGATNRPFDLDDAVIRRLPRRLYVDLPDADNRLKILKIILAQENLEPDFPLQNLANSTEGYSGSDLKNLCVAAAYRPVQELLEEEKKGDCVDGDHPVLRPLSLDDFILSKSKVGPSVAYDAASMNELRKWNEQYGEGGSRRKAPFGF